MEQSSQVSNAALYTAGIVGGCLAIAIASQILPFVFLGLVLDKLSSETKEQT